MARRMVIECDNCGIEIQGNPVTCTLDRVDRETNEAMADDDIERIFDLCGECARKLIRIFEHKEIVEEPAPEVEPETTEHPDFTQEEAEMVEEVTKTKVDHGKVMALYKAGWSRQQIADDMGLSYSQVNNSIARHKK